jgi:hypothetical protein
MTEDDGIDYTELIRREMRRTDEMYDCFYDILFIDDEKIPGYPLSVMDNLNAYPDYMINAVLDIYDELEGETHNIPSLKDVQSRLCDYFFSIIVEKHYNMHAEIDDKLFFENEDYRNNCLKEYSDNFWLKDAIKLFAMTKEVLNILNFTYFDEEILQYSTDEYKSITIHLNKKLNNSAQIHILDFLFSDVMEV